MSNKQIILKIIWNTLKISLMLVGAFMLGYVIYAHLSIGAFFVKPQYRDFWEDMTAYRLEADGHKSLEKLNAAYGRQSVRDYAFGNSVFAAFIPSESANLHFWIGTSLRPGESGPELNRWQIQFSLSPARRC